MFLDLDLLDEQDPVATVVKEIIPEQHNAKVKVIPPSEVHWTDGLSSGVPLAERQEFATSVFDALDHWSFCQIVLPQREELQREELSAAVQKLSFGLPPMEMEEPLLGRRSRSKFAFLHNIDISNNVVAPLAGCIKMLEEVSDVISMSTRTRLDFTSAPIRKKMLLRVPIGRGERQQLSPGPISEDDVEDRTVEDFVTFMQNRRLCLLHIVESRGGTLELRPLSSKISKAVKVSLSKDMIVIFRSDLMSYTFLQEAQTGPDIALQCWIVKQPDEVALLDLDGNHAGMEELYGGPVIGGKPQLIEEQLSITGLAAKQPGSIDCLEKNLRMIVAHTDTFSVVPSLRWDVNVYYADDPHEGPYPKTFAKHAGFMDDDMLLGFDPNFFHISPAEATSLAPAWRVLLESCFEAFQSVGHTMQSLRGKPIALFMADGGPEDDMHRPGWADDPEVQEAKLTRLGFNASGRIANSFGLSGSVRSVDTACSASLVATIELAALLRVQSHTVAREGMAASHQAIHSVGPFIGLAGAGMLGRSGRCRTFDKSANGYARGEAIHAAVIKTGGHGQDVKDRFGCFVTGYVNQDGRSASLTAPNGPSQQACIKKSHRQAGLIPQEIYVTENHGTGTALGDPIEVGSIRGVFWKNRENPIPVISYKSYHGHFEISAGLGGIIRSINTLRGAVATGQDHLYILNPHIDDFGFPGLFPVESTYLDVGAKGRIIGLNAFGFGGTNSRGELWVAHTLSTREHVAATMVKKLTSVTLPCTQCEQPMCFKCGLALPSEPLSASHRCTDIRAEVSSSICSTCYSGKYIYKKFQ